MVILGIDPGIGRTGWGVIEKVKSEKPARNASQSYAGGLKVKSFGCIETPSTDLLPDRLVSLKKEISKIVEEYKPDMVGIEELFFNTNAKTAMAVGQARGVIIGAIAEKNIPLLSFTPPEIKVAVAGSGAAPKDQIGRMVKILLKLDKIPKPDDTCDALACAIACASSYKLKMA